MKNLIVYTLIATLSFPLMVKSEEMKLPVISRPAALEEGTQTTLSQAEIAELLPWAKDSKMFLNDLVENIQGLSTADKIERLVDGIKQVVGESAPKNSELLMRYALNRGLVLHDLISKEASDEAVGTADAKIRVLRASIELAIKYYDTDIAILQKKTTAPYVIFGLDYFSFLSELNKSVFDASAQYAIQRTALEWLQWDLYRDLNNTAYAPQIVKINNSLKTFQNKKLTDAQSIASIRQMKAIAQQLRVEEVLKKIALDRQLAEAKSAAERAEILRKQQEEADRLALEKQRHDAISKTNDPSALVISAGDRIVDSRNFVGTVKAVFANGQLSVVFDWDGYSATETRDIKTVSKSVGCYERFCVGDKVIDAGNHAGTLQLTFANGKTRVKFDIDGYGASEPRDSSDLGKGVKCYAGICVGDRVIDNGGYVGKVQRVFDSGKARVVFDGYGASDNRTISQLSKEATK
jgi:hypothetical protein